MIIECPNCDGTGAIEHQITKLVHICNGDEEICQQSCPQPEPDLELEPCEMCETTGKINDELLKDETNET